MESGKILNSAITASSVWDSGHEPWRARLHNFPAMPYDTSKDTGSWSALTNQAGQYLQIDLGVMTYVTMIATQGRPHYSGTQYVTQYKLSFKNSNNIFVEYHANNRVAKVRCVSSRTLMLLWRSYIITSYIITILNQSVLHGWHGCRAARTPMAVHDIHEFESQLERS